MRRTEIKSSIIKVAKALKESGVFHVIDTFRGLRAESDMVGAIESYKKFAIEYETFNREERELINIFNLSELLEASFWSGFIEPNNEKAHRQFFSAHSSMTFIIEYGTILVELFEQKDLRSFHTKDEIKPPELADKEIITVILSEEKGYISKPNRITETIESTTLLYHAFAYLNDQSPDELGIIAIDSGSDKSFDFLGNVEAIKQLKEFILELWDRIVFYRETKEEKRMDLITKALPIIDKIGEMEENKRIGKEQAELIRRNIISGTQKFISVGAVIPEIEEHSSYSPKELMTPQRKMLTSGGNVKDASSSGSQDETEEFSNLSPEEAEKMKELMKKMKGGDQESNEKNLEEKENNDNTGIDENGG